MKLKLPERRRFIRIETPLRVVVTCGDRVEEVVTKNISPVGLRFEVADELDASRDLDLALFLTSDSDPIRLVCRLIWQAKTSLEDNAPFDVGIEIIAVEDSNKNVFLKYLCDLLYDSTYKVRT